MDVSVPPVDAAEEIECVDGTGVDEYGDGCDWYEYYPNECGWWDSDDFSAVEECCACEEKGTPDWCEYYDDQDCLDEYKYYHEFFRLID